MPDDLQSRQLFEQCIDQHADSLYRVALRLTGNRDLADELIQETYLQAWRNIQSLRDLNRMRGWMFAILRNQFSKMIRRLPKANQMTDLQAAEIVAVESQNEHVQAHVQSALNRLDDDQKLPLLLVLMEGLSVDEAAEILKIPRGTVLSRMHRGRQKLKQLLRPELLTLGEAVQSETDIPSDQLDYDSKS